LALPFKFPCDAPKSQAATAMNIRQQLMKRHSRANADLVEAHVRLHPEKVVELMACFFKR